MDSTECEEILEDNRNYYKTRRIIKDFSSTSSIYLRPSSPPVVEYPQQKFGITYHFAWILGLDWGEENNFKKTDYRLCDHSKIKHGYDLLTISAQNGGWVRYENFPIYRNGHRLEPVPHYVCVNRNELPMDIGTDSWHCINCGFAKNDCEAFLEFQCNSIEFEEKENISQFKKVCKKHLKELEDRKAYCCIIADRWSGKYNVYFTFWD